MILLIVFSEGLAGVPLNNKAGFINKAGKVIIPFDYDRTQGFYDGLAGVELRGKSGFINNDNKVVIPLKFNNINSIFKEDLNCVNLGEEWFFINKFGKTVFNLGNNRPSGQFFEGLVSVRHNMWGGKIGFLDKTGKFVIPPKYDTNIENFKDGFGKVSIGKKYFYINRNGKEYYEE